MGLSPSNASGRTITTEPDTSTRRTTPRGIAIPPASPDDALDETADSGVRSTRDRPSFLNAIDPNVTRLLDGALDRAEADDARPMILTGAGRAFSACPCSSLLPHRPDTGQGVPCWEI